MSGKLQGKVAVITGGSAGIGLATAKQFVAAGAYVYITGRRQSELDAAVREIGGEVTAVRADAAKPEDLDALYAQVARTHGRIDVLFANAGVYAIAPLEAVSAAHYDYHFDINVKGVIFSVQKALSLMPAGGSILITGSIAGSKGMEGFSVYSATKAAVRSLARTWAAELKNKGVRINVISPGPIATPGLDGLGGSEEGSAQLKQKLSSLVPLGRVGTAEEVAKTALFLASDDASYITGSEVFVDGGAGQV